MCALQIQCNVMAKRAGGWALYMPVYMPVWILSRCSSVMVDLRYTYLQCRMTWYRRWSREPTNACYTVAIIYDVLVKQLVKHKRTPAFPDRPCVGNLSLLRVAGIL